MTAAATEPPFGETSASLGHHGFFGRLVPACGSFRINAGKGSWTGSWTPEASYKNSSII